jgi:hypothetical protein
MMRVKSGRWLAVLCACACVGVVQAKLPAPSDEQKAKAAEAKEKAAQDAKNEAEQLGKAQDRVAERYRKGKGAAAPTKTAAEAKKR